MDIGADMRLDMISDASNGSAKPVVKVERRAGAPPGAPGGPFPALPK